MGKLNLNPLYKLKSKRSVKTALGRRLSAKPYKSREFDDGLNIANHAAITRSLRFMACHYTRPIQLNDIVEASGMSRRGFMKAFRRRIGRPPGCFIREAR